MQYKEDNMNINELVEGKVYSTTSYGKYRVKDGTLECYYKTIGWDISGISYNSIITMDFTEVSQWTTVSVQEAFDYWLKGYEVIFRNISDDGGINEVPKHKFRITNDIGCVIAVENYKHMIWEVKK